MSARRCAPWFVAAGILLAASGCGESRPTTYPAVIKLSYPDGKPVVGAHVVLRNEEHKLSARGETGADGSCRLTTGDGDGAVLGQHTVMVAKPPPKGDPDVPYTGPQIADKYQKLATSGLEITVTEDESKNVFPLTITAR
jgi:hypothetical protein